MVKIKVKVKVKVVVKVKICIRVKLIYAVLSFVLAELSLFLLKWTQRLLLSHIFQKSESFQRG